MDNDFKIPVKSGSNGFDADKQSEPNFGAGPVNDISIPINPIQPAEENKPVNPNNFSFGNHQNNNHHKPSETHSTPPQNNNPEPYNFSSPKEPKGIIIPYLASLIAGTILMVVAFYSLLGLISYVVEHTINESNNTSANLGYVSSFDHILALTSVAVLLVSLPISILMFTIVRKYEKRDEWRIKQKTRKMVYVVASVILILGILGSLSSMIYSILSTSLDANSIDSYSSLYGGDTANKINKSKELTSAVVQGVSALVLFTLAIVSLGYEYSSKMRKMLWGVFGLVAIIGLTLSAVTLMKVKSASDAGKKASSSSKIDTQKDVQYDYPTDLATPTQGVSMSQLDGVKYDLDYYKIKNSNYPLLSQWKDGSLKKEYLLSPQDTLDKITYNPSGCDDKGCKSYELTAKDADGKTISVKSN